MRVALYQSDNLRCLSTEFNGLHCLIYISLYMIFLSLKRSDFRSNERYLRLLPTFAVVLREKIRVCASFTKMLANYISEESLIRRKEFYKSNFLKQLDPWLEGEKS